MEGEKKNDDVGPVGQAQLEEAKENINENEEIKER
jgi:hypothetical protein